MKVGPRAIAMMHHFEGCRLVGYLPTPNDVPTIGWGNTTYLDGRKVKLGDRITQAEADALFEGMLQKFAKGVEQLIDGAATTPAQFGAMVCLAYNIGIGAFARSTVLRLHKVGDWDGAAKAFLPWNKQAGRVLTGLVRRRQTEALLYSGKIAEFDKAIGYKEAA